MGCGSSRPATAPTPEAALRTLATACSHDPKFANLPLDQAETLTTLSLAGCPLSAPGSGKAVAGALPHLKALTALDVSNNGFGDEGARLLASDVRSNINLTFIRAAGNGIRGSGGSELADALAESANEHLCLDLSHNYAVEWRDQVAIRLSNLKREPLAGPSPLDGWGKQEE